MSIRVMGEVWECDLSPNHLIVLLSLADHAEHDGSNVFPSQALTAWKTGYSDRQVNRIILELVAAGILVETDRHGRAVKYRIDLSKAPRKQPFVRKSRSDKMSDQIRHSYVGSDQTSPRVDDAPNHQENIPKPLEPVAPQRDLAFEWVVTEVLHGTVEAVKVDRNLQGLANRMLSSLVAQEKLRRGLKAAQPLSKDARAELAARLPGLKRFWLDAHPGLSERDFPSTPPAFSKVVAQWYAAGCPQGAVAQPLTPVLTYDPDCPLHCDHGLKILPDGRAVDCACRTRILAQYGVQS